MEGDLRQPASNRPVVVPADRRSEVGPASTIRYGLLEPQFNW